MISRPLVDISASHRLVVIELARLHDRHLRLLHLRVCPLRERVDNRPHIVRTLVELRPGRLKLRGRPVHRGLFKVFDAILKHFFFLDELGHVGVGILARVFLEYLEPHPEVLVLILQHKYVGIEVVYVLPLLLDVLPETEVALQHLLHHVDRVNDALGDRIFRFIDCARQVSSRACGDILESFTLLSEELLYVILILDDSFGDDQSSLR